MRAHDQATDAVLRRALRERAAGDDFDILGDVLRAVESTPQRRALGGWRFRFAPLALATTGLVVGVLIVLALVTRQPPDVGPSPAPGPTNAATPQPTSSPGVPLGGGLILVSEPHEPRAECEDMGSHAPFDLSLLDAGTGERTFLGTVAEDCSAIWLTLQWGSDREHVLVTDEMGMETLALDTPTAAGGELTFICCDFPTDIWEGGGTAFDGWMLSPAGDRVSAIRTSVLQIPGQDDLGVGISDGIVVVDIDGSNQTTLRLPAGAAIRGWANWSADSTELVVAGCSPCNHAIEPGQPATGENHEHLYVVPVDGSPVRELLDDSTGSLWTPAWSPDGSTFATVRRECLPDEAPPQCNGESTASILLVAAEDGAQRTLVTSDQLGEGLSSIGLPLWSRDSGRIAFTAFSADGDEPHVFVVDAGGTNLADVGEGSLAQWSPDGEWLLVVRPSTEEPLSEIWIMRPDGSDARSLGDFLFFNAGAAW